MTDDQFDPDRPFALPITTDPDEIRAEMHAAMAARVPGWEPVDTALDVQIMAAVAEVDGEARQALDDRVTAELTDLLGDLFDIPRGDGTPASSIVTVAARDTLGHTELAGASVWVGDVELTTTTDLIVSPGTDTATVAVSAIEPGAHTNGATGDVSVDAWDWLAETTNAVLNAPLAGGVDPEDDLDYRIRLTQELRLMSPRPILPVDFAVLALRVPAVQIAWPINLYRASTNTPGVARAITVVVADEQAGVLPGSVLDDVRARLRGASGPLANLDVEVVSPTYTEIEAVGIVTVRAGWDETEVCAAVADRLAERLSPAGWVQGWYGQDVAQPPSRRVHVNDLVSAASQVEGVEFVSSMQIGGEPAPYVDLPLPTGLPTAGPISVTATP